MRVLGIDPDPRTYREVDRMLRGRLKHTWDQTAALWAMIANTARDPEQRPEPFTPFDIHPYREAPPPVETGNASGFWWRINQLRNFEGDGRMAALNSILHGD